MVISWCRREPEVLGLRTSLVKKSNVAMIYLLCDVLHIVNNLSLYLQKETNFADVPFKVKATLDKLDLLIQQLDCRGQNRHCKFSRVDDAFLSVIERTSLQRRVCNDDADMSPEVFLREIGLPFIRSLSLEIEDACQFSPVLDAFQVLDPRNLPNDVVDLASYGESEIQKLANFYENPKEDTFEGHVVVALGDFDSQDGVEGEFRQKAIRPGHQMTTMDAYHYAKSDGVVKAVYPRMVKLLKYAVLIPYSTAVAERGFSLMNSICTTLRSKLTQSSLESLIRVCREGQDDLEETDLELMVDEFKDKKQRKLDL